MAKYVMHEYEPADGSRMLHLSLDDKWFRIPTDEPFEMTTDSNGRQLDHPDFYCHMLLQIYSMYGLVEIEQTKTRTGIMLNTDKAAELAEARLVQSRHMQVNNWCVDMLQSRVRAGMPVLPPTGFVEEAIKFLNIDVKAKYGFTIIGWDWRPDTNRPIDGKPANVVIPAQGGSTDVAELMEQLAVAKAQNTEMARTMLEMQNRFEAMMGRMANFNPPVPGPSDPPTEHAEEDEAESVGASGPSSRGRRKSQSN